MYFLLPIKNKKLEPPFDLLKGLHIRGDEIFCGCVQFVAKTRDTKVFCRTFG